MHSASSMNHTAMMLKCLYLSKTHYKEVKMSVKTNWLRI